MAYILKDDLFYIFTEKSTRKYKNILENNQASIIVGGFKDDPSIQIDGTIRELSLEEGAKITEFTLGIYPDWGKYFESPDGRWFEIKPFWMRYGNSPSEPPEVFEVTV